MNSNNNFPSTKSECQNEISAAHETKIYTLGTSHGGTEVGRSCSGNLIQCGEDFYLFDCGGDVERIMKDMNLPIGRLKAVFISHMHGDHVVNLPAIAKCFIVGYTRMDTKINIFMPDEIGLDAFKIWLKAIHLDPESDKLKLAVFEQGIVYQDENLKVYSIRTEHLFDGKVPSFAFALEFSDGKSLLYTGDLNCDFHDYPKIVFEKDFDIILSELVHFDIKKNLDTIIKSRTKKMIFTHLSPRNIPVIESCRESFPFDFVVAEDKMCFEF